MSVKENLITTYIVDINLGLMFTYFFTGIPLNHLTGT